ncbi:Serine/threonine-protein kinase pdik1l-B [Mycena sanguinolenta]|uniref:Serine/threonine-protein kinase pdik1l-B n=1 Tax=Mycena sanguinolenta TaxID=230812 RepID=A0A8H6Y2C3_9AGAR|nr:Serine/threonine-protein kinase pdik1l-B [Mycena sanguinolenta]
MGSIDHIATLIKLGRTLHKNFKKFKNADKDLSKLDSQLDISLFVLETFQTVIRDGTNGLIRDQKDRISSLLVHLQGLFDRLERMFSRFPHDDKLKLKLGDKVRWTFGGKSDFEDILHEMERWQARLRDVIEAIKFLQDPATGGERALYKKLFELGGRGVSHADMVDDVFHRRIDAPIPKFKDWKPDFKRMVHSPHHPNCGFIWTAQTWVFMETRRFDKYAPQSVDDVRLLASALGKVDTNSMYILRCLGMARDTRDRRDNRYVLLYAVPNQLARRTNWTLAMAIDNEPKPALNVRIRYAIEICTAVMFTHSSRLVHKSICPENVLILPHAANGSTMQTASTYLVGFDAARFDEPEGAIPPRANGLQMNSNQAQEILPKRRWYHHPARHGHGRVVQFGIRHDMYSLGVVLLELGMWTRLQRILSMSAFTRGEFDAKRLQGELVRGARLRLDGEMGSKYMDAVICCLEDAGGPKATERQTREVFYERVLRQLRQIVV